MTLQISFSNTISASLIEFTTGFVYWTQVCYIAAKNSLNSLYILDDFIDLTIYLE